MTSRYRNSFQFIARKSLLVNGLGWFGPGSFLDLARQHPDCSSGATRRYGSSLTVQWPPLDAVTIAPRCQAGLAGLSLECSRRPSGLQYRLHMSLHRIQLVFLAALLATAASPTLGQSPSVIFILADDLGYGDLGSYGQQLIQTPRLDRMAAQGLRFTDFYAGATVCAPSRCVLMTGKHLGHAHVRGNASGAGSMIMQSLREEDVTIAEVMRAARYSTALIGKWGLGELDEPGHPLNQGFETFYGYLNQVHAHNYYPEFLWRGRSRESLRNVVEREREYGGFRGGWATERKSYSHDLFMNEALSWIRSHREEPFFLYLPLTIPHANNEATRGVGDGAEVPDHGIYSDLRWPEPDRGQAAMITRMDRGVGRILDLLVELDIAEDTLVLFSSDNGPHNEAGHNPTRFNPSGPLRGMKRDLYEGGIRVPFLAWWPGVIQPGRVSDHVGYFGDVMATLSELVGQRTPAGTDSVSFLPVLTGKGEQAKHEFLYWEFYEGGSAQAVRIDNWKGVREPMLTGPIELYDLSTDPGEKYNISRSAPKVVEAMEQIMEREHQPHPNWKPPTAR